jgi:hypothetical protein
MEIDKKFIELKINQFDQNSLNAHENSIYNKGAADCLRVLLEELEKQEPVKVEDLIKDAEIIGGQ